MRILIWICLATLVSGADKLWKQARVCVADKQPTCPVTCKQTDAAQLDVDCNKRIQKKADESLISCLKERGIDIDKKQCWKPNKADSESNFQQLKQVTLLVATYQRMSEDRKAAALCGIDCSKNVTEKCFEDCTGTEDKSVKQGLKICMPKALQTTSSLAKECGKPPQSNTTPRVH